MPLQKHCAALILLLLAACAALPETTFTRLNIGDSGKTIVLAPGQTLSIVLDSNASTGSVWTLVLEPDEKVLEFVSQEYASKDIAPGAGGIETWEFKAAGAGATSLRLQSFRPFDAKEVQGEFFLQVQVR